MDTDREYLEITFETIDEGITIYDENLKLVIWNRHYKAMGITPDEFLYRGSSLLESYVTMAKRGVFGEGDPDELAAQRINALKNGPLIKFEYLNAATDRLIRIKRFRLKNGGICATFRDVTEERQIEKQLRQSSKLDALGRLSGGVAHDLNNVLAIIMGNLELAKVKPLGCQDHVQLALDASERGATLVRSLLAFARQQTLQPSVANVAKSMSYLNAMLEPLVSDFVTLEISSADPLWLVEIDIDQFETTLVNLVVNAKDASNQGGVISIDAANTVIKCDDARLLGIDAGEYVQVVVADNGSGMNPDVLENAIDPFFTTKPLGQGTGLGLSMAHGFASQSQGYLIINSEQNTGTSVHLYLPRSLREQHKEIVRDHERGASLSGLRVLVVDDDEMVNESVVAQIRSLGCAVNSADSGVEAIVNNDWKQIDVLITDRVMPKVDGPLLAEIALSENPDLKVVLMSGYVEEAILEQRESLPTIEILKKPFRLAQLSKAIERALEQ